MKSLMISHAYDYHIGSMTFICKRCGHIINWFEIDKSDILAMILKLTKATCELRYDQVKDLLDHMTIEEVHNS